MNPRWHLIDEHEIVWLVADHAEQRRLCALLESVADGLPDLPSGDRLRALEHQLSAYSQRHFVEESNLFLRLSKTAADGISDRILREIRYNHAIDAIHADDLSAELNRLSESRRAAHPAALSYMLRCFFDGCRRAIAFEELARLKLAGNRLTPAARLAVRQSFEAS